MNHKWLPHGPEAAHFRRLTQPRSPAFSEQVLSRLRFCIPHCPEGPCPPPRTPAMCKTDTGAYWGRWEGWAGHRSGCNPAMCFHCRRHDRPVPLLHSLFLSHHCRLLSGPDATLHPGLLLSAGECPAPLHTHRTCSCRLRARLVWGRDPPAARNPALSPWFSLATGSRTLDHPAEASYSSQTHHHVYPTVSPKKLKNKE